MADPRPLLTRRLGRRQLLALDAAMAVAVTLLCAYAASERPVDGGPQEPAWVGLLVAAALGAPVAVRRRWPLPVLAWVLAAAAVALLTEVIPVYAVLAPFLAPAVALHAVALAEPRRRSLPALAVSLLVAAACAVAASAGWVEVLGGGIFMWLMLGAPWTVGRAARERRAHSASTAAQLAHQAVTDERLRIARELHDIVAHSMSLIAVKAAVANHVADVRPGEARAALRVIESISKTALADLRGALGTLRAEAAFDPAPGVRDLGALVEAAAAAGVRAELSVRGVDDLPEALGLSVYRIVQESLTNVVQHAAPARCRVAVEADGHRVRIEVVDDGRAAVAAPRDGAGHGLIGMRERVAIYGGDFTAGPRPEGGFAVYARLPRQPSAAAG